MGLVKNLGSELFIGIDGGGSKCKAVIVNRQGDILGRGIGGPANPFYGIDRALSSILESSKSAINDAKLPQGAVSSLIAGIGLAGVNLPALYEKLNQWQHPFGAMFLTTDMDIANIGAHDGNEGAVIIVGTGSCGFISNNGEKRMYGGHGFPIGDKGSGAWLGLKAIEHTLLAIESYEFEGILTDKICQFFDVNNGISLSEKLVGKASQHYAKVASIVFDSAEQGDRKAIEIIIEGAGYLSELARRLLQKEPKRLCMIGGLAGYMLPKLDKDVRVFFEVAKQQPEVGAFHFALQQWSQEKTNKQGAIA